MRSFGCPEFSINNQPLYFKFLQLQQKMGLFQMTQLRGVRTNWMFNLMSQSFEISKSMFWHRKKCNFKIIKFCNHTAQIGRLRETFDKLNHLLHTISISITAVKHVCIVEVFV